MSKGQHMRKLTEAQRQEIIGLYMTPNSDGTWTGCPSIARRYGVTPTAIRGLLDRADVRMRASSEAYAHGKRTKPIKNVPPENQIVPSCRCGCSSLVGWNQRKNRWNVYAEGHYRRPAPYKQQGWLHEQYVTLNKTVRDIASLAGVRFGTIIKFMDKFAIQRRDRSTSRVGRKVGAKNPAWKGGVADWPYASNWKMIARRIRKRDNYTCQICGQAFPKQSPRLHVHHRNGKKFDNEDSNLIAVCAGCHPRGKRKENWSPA